MTYSRPAQRMGGCGCECDASSHLPCLRTLLACLGEAGGPECSRHESALAHMHVVVRGTRLCCAHAGPFRPDPPLLRTCQSTHCASACKSQHRSPRLAAYTMRAHRIWRNPVQKHSSWVLRNNNSGQLARRAAPLGWIASSRENVAAPHTGWRRQRQRPLIPGGALCTAAALTAQSTCRATASDST